jgi:hypothetical protein
MIAARCIIICVGGQGDVDVGSTAPPVSLTAALPDARCRRSGQCHR